MSESQTSQPIPPKYLQEDELSEECKKLLLTLPKERGWISSHIYNYQGFWIGRATTLQGVLAFQQHFQAQDSDIILVTTPKSGTTWLKALVFALVNRKEYPFSGQDHPLLVKNPHDLVPFLELKLYLDGKVPDFSSFTSPRLLSSHLVYASLPNSVQDSESKLIYLCRNPRDTFISFWHFTNTLRLHYIDTSSIEEVFDLFCKGVSLFGPFWDHVLDYWKKSLENPKRVLFLMYEEIKENPEIQLKRLAKFLECPFSIDEEKCGVVDEILKMCSFENLSNLEVNKNEKLSTGVENKVFFRRGEVGDWKNYFTTKMIEKLDHIIEQKFQGSGLRFRYI
ncbi:PREDICTED: cytosolic sulfotransferase 12-like [Nicotiana attenuata]|uniref:Sulfotransferase n=1 Tax=Nicotiana attenuata TaxID=49451 RepID=A0A1J6HSI4_NICAT|nr:PREDICTED: cytosolic sulfotransferase 12-like [Nicotiana attenuata]OIS95877.1 cytosolic sulfotransferase 12 [Nicotiana attenuata]